MPAKLRVGLAENKFLSGGLRLRGHGGSLLEKIQSDSIVKTHECD